VTGVYVNKSTNGGLTFQNSKLISRLKVSGITIRLPSMAVDISNGPLHGSLYAVWSNEFMNTGNEDIYISFSRDRGANWSEPKKIHSDSLSGGIHQYWPWVTVDGYGNIYVIYYCSINTNMPLILNSFIAFSTNGGINFVNYRLSSESFSNAYLWGEIRFGDYIG
jgi:hypothetical protein